MDTQGIEIPKPAPLRHADRVEMIAVADLVPYARNARTHSDAQVRQLAASIAEWGFTNPVLVDPDNGIIAGHGRVLAAQSLKIETIPCLRLGWLSDAQKRAYMIADNKLPLSAGWDDELLAIELRDLKTADYDLKLMGFDDRELVSFMASTEPPPETDPDEIPEKVETRCKPGDLWQLGRHRLLCGDSTNVQHVERLMGKEKADMVFTDPPYGLNWSGGTWAKNMIYEKAKEWDHVINQDTIDYILMLADKVVLWGGNYYKVPPSRCWLSWRKSNAMKTMSDFELAWTNFDKCCKEFVSARNSEGKRQHPTQKPVALAEWCFTNYGEPQSVLDLFLGSGSTLIACEKTGRRCFGMEIDPHYCDLIIQRWQKYVGDTQQAMLLDSTSENTSGIVEPT